MIKKALQNKVGELTLKMYAAGNSGNIEAQKKYASERDRIANRLIWWSSARERWPVKTLKWILASILDIFSFIVALIMLAVAYPLMWITQLYNKIIGSKQQTEGPTMAILTEMEATRIKLESADIGLDPVGYFELSEKYKELTVAFEKQIGLSEEDFISLKNENNAKG